MPSLFGKERELKEVVQVQKVTERHSPKKVMHSPERYVERDMISDEPLMTHKT